MRACASCFWCPRQSHDRDADTGECWNRPPVIFSVPAGHDDAGRALVSFVSQRPTVGLQEFCAFFRHYKEKPTEEGKAA